MLLSIIIVSFNTSKLLEDCLQSIYRALKKGNLTGKSEVIVVDNASTDGSRDLVKKTFPLVNLVANKKNIGFAAGNNLGIKRSKGKYILLLNSDTQVLPNSLSSLIDEIEKDKSIGVVGGKLLNSDDSLQPSAGYFPFLHKIFFWMIFIDDLPFLKDLLRPYHQQSSKFYEKPQNTDWVSGACFMVRRQALLKAGFLDEKIFMYGEEVELCYRIKRCGYEIRYSPSPIIYHLKGASGAGKDAGIVEEFSYLLYFYKKHKPSWQLFWLKIFLMFGAMLRIFVFGIIGRNSKKAFYYAKAFKMAG